MKALSKVIVLSLLVVMLFSHQFGDVDLHHSSYTPSHNQPAQSQSNAISCPINQFYDNTLWQCVCMIGYTMSNGICQPNANHDPICGRNQVYKDRRCVCAQGFYLIGNICHVCPAFETYDVYTLSCKCAIGYQRINGDCALIFIPPPIIIQPPVPECGVNEHRVGGICTCLKDFYLVKGRCTYCVSPNYYDASLAICRPTCKSNEQLDINSLTCICLGGYFKIKGDCGTCPPYAVYNSIKNVCDCIQGYMFNGGRCVPQTFRPLQPAPLPVDPRDCQDINAFRVNGVCVCKSTYHRINGVCQRCQDNSFFDVDLGVCRIACQPNESYNINTQVCDCAPGFFKVDDLCRQCVGDSTFNPNTRTCECPSGKSLDALGNCIIGCGINQVFKSGKCGCKTNFYPVNGVCGQCQWNQVYDRALGICRVPCDQKRIFDISLAKCVCLPHFWELIDGTCGTCPVHSSYYEQTKTCVCDAGFEMSLGLCVPKCNAFEIYNNGICQCRQGYYLIGHSCGLCPPTQQYTATYRLCHIPCKRNEVWDPIIRACRCRPGYSLIDNTCGMCHGIYETYNHKTQCCDCVSGYKKVNGPSCTGSCRPICSSNENWVISRCVCKPGFFLINNFCTKCPEGQMYDIYQRVCRVKCGTNQVYNFFTEKCECAQGYYIVDGSCSRCQSEQTYNEYTQSCHISPCPGINEYFSTTTQTCICKPRYVKIRGVCTNCNPGYYYDSYSDRCLCKPGYVEHGGFCKAVCPNDQKYFNGKCVCNNGLPLYNGKCIQPQRCPINARFDKNSGCCVCNAGFSVIGGKCSSYQYCGVNGYLKYGQCYCNEGYNYILGACRSCGQNEAFNGVACECYLGYTRGVNGHCIISNTIPHCHDNQRYEHSLRACVCVQGTQLIRGRCIQIPTCPANSVFNSVNCACISGYMMQNQVCVSVNKPIPSCPSGSFFNGVSCSCNIGFFQQAINSCASCPSGTVWDGQKCSNQPDQSCLAGYIFNSNIQQCEPAAPSCGDFAFYNGATCVCLSGYHLINDVCMRCPTGSQFDGSQCSLVKVTPEPTPCGSNQVRVNNECVCNDGLHLINNECLACPRYTTWNGKFCQCGCDPQAWCLGEPFSAWDSENKICNCQSGYTRVNGICMML